MYRVRGLRWWGWVTYSRTDARIEGLAVVIEGASRDDLSVNALDGGT